MSIAMESLSYIFWVLCVVQIITVNGRPDFATSFQFPATPRISQLSNDISSLFASLDDELTISLSGSIPDSEEQRLLLVEFAENFGVSARAVTDELADSASSTSSMGTTLANVLTAYSQLVVFFNTNANNFLSSTHRDLGPYLTVELFSGLVRLVTSFPQVRMAIEALQARLQSASTAEDVPSDVLRSLARALQLLKAHVPLLVYTFQRVGINLQTAEIFMFFFNEKRSAGFMRETDAFFTELSAFEAAVGRKFTSAKEMFDSAGTQVETELTGEVESQANYMSMRNLLKSFTSDRSMFLDELKQAILLASTANRQAIGNEVTTTYYVGNSYTVESAALELVMQLISSKVYDRLCYMKYVALVEDLPTLGRVRLSECFHTELPRLQKLQELIETYSLMVSYDVEDLWHNLNPCRSQYAAVECLSMVSAHYPTLNAARVRDSETRAGNFFTSALTASLKRIERCFTRTNFFTFLNLVPSLEQDIRSCREASCLKK